MGERGDGDDRPASSAGCCATRPTKASSPRSGKRCGRCARSSTPTRGRSLAGVAGEAGLERPPGWSVSAYLPLPASSASRRSLPICSDLSGPPRRRPPRGGRPARRTSHPRPSDPRRSVARRCSSASPSRCCRLADLAPLRQIFRGSSEPLGVMLGGLVIYLVGLVDDLREISAPAKVAGQVLAAMVLVFLGSRCTTSSSPSYSPIINALPFDPSPGHRAVGGRDGERRQPHRRPRRPRRGDRRHRLGGVVRLRAAARPPRRSLGDNLGPLVAAIACGVCIGFLPHNFHPAKMFMGDGGALFLGLPLAAATMVIGGRTENPLHSRSSTSPGSPSSASRRSSFRFSSSVSRSSTRPSRSSDERSIARGSPSEISATSTTVSSASATATDARC